MLTDIEVGHENCLALAEHWQSLPKEGLIPYRASLRPERVPGLLPNMIMFELISRDHIRIRLAGTAIVDRYGLDPTGYNYLDFVAEERRRKSAEAMWLMQEQPCGMWGLTQQNYEGGKCIRSEAIGFPLRGLPGEPMILLFQQVAVSVPRLLDTRAQRFHVNTIVERRFIDIGAGVPDFRD